MYIYNYKLFLESNNQLKTITLYHGSPYKFDNLKSQEEVGFKQNSQDCSGASFTEKFELAEKFANGYPSEYYELKDDITNIYNNIEKIIYRKEQLEGLESLDNLNSKLEKQHKELMDSWERYKTDYDWLDEGKQWEKFESDSKYSLEEFQKTKAEIKRIEFIHKTYKPLSAPEINTLEKYNKELELLDKVP